MAKFLFGLITGVVLSVAGLLLIFFALARTFRESPPVVAQNSVLQLQLSGDIPERPPVEVPFGALAERPAATVTGIWMALRKAAADPRIKAVVLEPEALSAGLGQAGGIPRRSGSVPQSGKPVFAYLRIPRHARVLPGPAADRIYLGPSDRLMLKGLRAEADVLQEDAGQDRRRPWKWSTPASTRTSATCSRARP